MAAYDAFISYSHAKDKPVAAALQSVIQRLGKRWYRRRALRVFRDDTSLSATPGLWPSIEQALGHSRFLVLLASPEAAASSWVNKEVSFWLESKGADTLLIALTDGELAWDNAVSDFNWRGAMTLPPVLKGRFPSEPKWVDLRAWRDGANPREARFIEAGADFAAAIHGLPKEDLLSQEVRQQRRALTIAWSGASTLAGLMVLAGWQWWEADSAKRIAQGERDRAVAAEQLAQAQRDRAEKNFSIAKSAADQVVFRFAQGLRNVQGMQVAEVHRILDTARAMVDQLADAAPDDLELQRSRATMLLQFADTYTRAGDLSRAEAAADESLAILRRLDAAEPDKILWQSLVSVGLGVLGDVRLARGDRAGALVLYEDSLAVARKAAVADASDARWQEFVSDGLGRVGDGRRAAGDWAGALAAYVESLAIARRLAADGPDDAAKERKVTLGLDKIGDVRLAAGDWAGALAAYEEALGILRRLAAADPGNSIMQNNVSLVLVKIADVRLGAGDRSLAPYEESLAIRRKLAADDPGHAGWQRSLSIGFEKLGDVRLAVGDRTGALAAYEEMLGILRKLTAADPGNTGWQRDLSVALLKAGDARLAAGERAGALAAYEESLAIRRRLAAADPGNALWQTDLGIILSRISQISDPPRARAALREALAIFEALERDKKLPVAQQSWPQIVRDTLTRLPPEAADAR